MSIVPKKLNMIVLALSTLAVSTLALGAEVGPNQAASLYAESFNVSQQEAEKRISIMSQTDEISKKIIDKFGEKDIAGIFFVHEGDFKLIVRTTKQGKGSRDVLNFANQEFPDLNIEVKTNSPRNFRSIENILKNQPDVLSRKIDGFQSLGYSPEEDKLLVGIYDPTLKSAEEAIEKYKISKVAGMDVRVNLLKQPIGFSALIGGATITGGIGACTSGFSAYGADKTTKGIITAYHCTNNGQTKNYVLTDQNGNKHSLVPTNQPLSANQDITFLKSTSNSVPIEPYVVQVTQYSSGNNVSKFPIQSQGRKSELRVGSTFLCHSGISTNFSCGLVTSVNSTLYATSKLPSGATVDRCKTDGAYCYNFIAVSGQDLRCAPGDSGGPVTIGNTAYGIVSSCNYDKIPQGDVPLMHLSSLDYLNEFPVYLSTAPSN